MVKQKKKQKKKQKNSTTKKDKKLNDIFLDKEDYYSAEYYDYDYDFYDDHKVSNVIKDAWIWFLIIAFSPIIIIFLILSILPLIIIDCIVSYQDYISDRKYKSEKNNGRK